MGKFSSWSHLEQGHYIDDSYLTMSSYSCKLYMKGKQHNCKNVYMIYIIYKTSAC